MTTSPTCVLSIVKLEIVILCRVVINRIAPSTTCSCLVFVSNFVPETEIKMAPIGAVRTILRTHIINTISAYLWSSAEDSLSSAKRLRATGPRAACTVAFAIQESATKI